MDNLTRMITLADEFFGTTNDPAQLTITEEVMEQLAAIHPAAMGERTNEQGPVAWTIVIPTTRGIRDRFLRGEIGETELMTRTLENADRHRQENRQIHYTSIYLCSALVLPEFRGNGLAKELVCNSIRAIRQDHPIEDLFVWSFSTEGNGLATSVARETGLPLRERNSGDHNVGTKPNDA